MENKYIGPVLKESELYSLLDESISALKKVKETALGGDLTLARRLFADHIRNGGYSELFFKNRDTVSTKTFLSYDEKKLAAEAERVLSHELMSVGVPHKFGKDVDWFYNATYNGYREWTWQLSRHYDLRILAAAYEKFGDEKYAEGLVELLSSWIKQALRPEYNESDNATLCWRTIECGIRMSVWPSIFFPILKSAAVTDEFIVAFYSSLYEHGERLVRSKTQNNWRNIELSGFASLAVLFGVFEKSKAWREYTAKGIYDHLMHQIHPDGFQFELSTGYHRVVLRESLHGAAVLRLSGYRMPDDFYKTITDMFEMYVKLMQSGGLIPDINDGRLANVKSFMPLDGEIEETPLIKWAKSGCPEEGSPKENTLHVFENAGLVTMRDSWYNTKTSIFFDAGKLGRSHQHEDKLNLLLYKDGKEILTEGHNYAYDSSDMRKYVISSFSHNTVIVDGKGQNRRRTYLWDDSMLNTKEDIKAFASEKLDYASGIYNEAYGTEGEITDVSHKREVVFLKKTKVGSAAVIVIDTITAECEHTYEALWHLDVSEVKLFDKCAFADDISIAFSLGNVSLTKGQTEPFVQGFVCDSTIQGDYRPIPTLINRVVAKDAKIVTVFSFGQELSNVELNCKNVNLNYQSGECETVELPF